jgi:hypothetical protein
MTYPAPSYLDGLVSDVSPEILSLVHENYGDNTTAFKFNVKFNGLVQTWLNEYNDYGGTLWGINLTGNKILLFDQFRHGYSGLMGLNEEEDFNSTKSISFPQATEIITAFQYSGDENEYVSDGTSKFEQDYFGWIVIYKLNGDVLEELINYECA